jgi:Matrixin
VSRWHGWWISTLAAAVVIAVAHPDAPPESHAQQATASIHSVQLEIELESGAPVLMTFEVRAADAAEAESAARRGLAQLAPGAAVIESGPGTVGAQWARWSWLWDDSELPVPIAYNPTDAPPTVSPQMVVAALQTWSTVPASKFAFRYAGVTDRAASMNDGLADGENVIAWAKLDCSTGCILGITSKRTPHESDLVLNSDPAAEIVDGQGGTNDARTVILHELGHIAGLEHSCPSPFGPCTDAERAAVMYFQYLGVRRKLADDDVAGISALYPKSNPQPTPTPLPGATPEPPKPELPVVLESGWNLVVLPAGDAATTASSLPCTLGIYDFRDGSWATWIPGAPPGARSLSSLEASRAYWVLASSPCAHVFGD